jgi:mono/diheme cytochrome c family protein
MTRICLILISGVCALVGASLAKAQQTSQATTGWFQQAQADQGHQLFNNYCAQCHRPDLTGALGPALKGQPFWINGRANRSWLSMASSTRRCLPILRIHCRMSTT